MRYNAVLPALAVICSKQILDGQTQDSTYILKHVDCHEEYRIWFLSKTTALYIPQHSLWSCTMDNTADSTNNTANTLVGWTSESPGRGTWAIISSCLFTIFICTWTAIHPRVHTNHRLLRLHKLAQLVKTILAPEMVCLESLQEWVQARKMVKRSAAATDGGMTMIHSFYIGMLGIRYRTDSGNKVLWPSQYAWLLNNDLVKWADRDSWGLSEQSIRDKNKADGVMKLAALCQVIWFVVQCSARAAHGLPIAPLETMTLAYVVVVVITYLFWWTKPKDIATASFVDLPAMSVEQMEIFESLSMENTYDEDDTSLKNSKSIAWYLVARDCKDDEVLVMGHLQAPSSTSIHETEHRIPSVDSNISLDSISLDRVSPASSISGSEPLHRVTTTKEASEDQKIITEWDEALYFSKFWPLICAMGAAFGAFHLISWDSTFPTMTECWLWRGSAIVSVVTSIVCMQFKAVALRWDGPLTILRVGSPVLYLVSRAVMMVEAFVALRAMPASAYDTYVISNYLFHIF